MTDMEVLLGYGQRLGVMILAHVILLAATSQLPDELCIKCPHVIRQQQQRRDHLMTQPCLNGLNDMRSLGSKEHLVTHSLDFPWHTIERLSENCEQEAGQLPRAIDTKSGCLVKA